MINYQLQQIWPIVIIIRISIRCLFNKPSKRICTVKKEIQSPLLVRRNPMMDISHRLTNSNIDAFLVYFCFSAGSVVIWRPCTSHIPNLTQHFKSDISLRIVQYSLIRSEVVRVFGGQVTYSQSRGWASALRSVVASHCGGKFELTFLYPPVSSTIDYSVRPSLKVFELLAFFSCLFGPPFFRIISYPTTLILLLDVTN